MRIAPSRKFSCIASKDLHNAVVSGARDWAKPTECVTALDVGSGKHHGSMFEIMLSNHSSQLSPGHARVQVKLLRSSMGLQLLAHCNPTLAVRPSSAGRWRWRCSGLRFMTSRNGVSMDARAEVAGEILQVRGYL
ncbi:hypothetical protein HBH56_053110 [Parastagonospora nodorum]|uniref:Uncharacterized protein n=1 Tax=Phaeosphaeria nodorum (strain SN15 / ATCC MYA-4574 / FGSC 10173) TaxID=321614 RepID=A0A7U2FG51_PHANO|nr:hypothetical protein HBH56_053110 [Parastagonospora nodorum]QRD02231.1 hypothetical protein JI435_440570 [Parastagonospora nodorum SN15]KAH3935567.1 hypothetical protein HBH54_038910 [Parastagonospora nodorum]KAH4053587.1 hypothetical protein HBH49_085730 [Parastagonospora nodorum]KAH4067286.1 hypothetical protein HBH50_138100 [Parastagonospora nodorum]